MALISKQVLKIDKNVVYKNVLVILFFCLSALGCSQNSKEKTSSQLNPEPASKQELLLAPDEMLSSFSVSGYGQDKAKQWDLEGKSADIMEEQIKLKDVTGKVYGKDTNMLIVAQEGSLNRVDNNVHLENNVVVTSDDGARLTADYLDWDAQNQKLSSDNYVSIDRGIMQASGKGFMAEPVLNQVELKEDVTVNISALKEASVVQGESGSNQPLVTVITCSGPLEVDYQNNLATFYDKVKVKDKRGEILAEKIDVYFSVQNDQTKQLEGMQGLGIDRVVAWGAVQIHHGSNVTYSEKAVYEADTGKITLTGQPKLVIYSTEDLAKMMQINTATTSTTAEN